MTAEKLAKPLARDNGFFYKSVESRGEEKTLKELRERLWRERERKRERERDAEGSFAVEI